MFVAFFNSYNEKWILSFCVCVYIFGVQHIIYTELSVLI